MMWKSGSSLQPSMARSGKTYAFRSGSWPNRLAVEIVNHQESALEQIIAHALGLGFVEAESVPDA
jgi:hypothetical protein